MKKTVILLVLFLFYFSIVSAKEIDTLSLKEIEFKINTLEEINSKLLNSIYLTIGLVGAIFSAIVALNFYQNFSINSKKFEVLRNELNDMNDKLKLELVLINKKEIQDKLASLDKSVEKALANKLSEHKSDLIRLKSDYSDLKRENLILTAEKFKEKQQRGYILNYIDILEMDIQSDRSFRIFETLEVINSHLKSNGIFGEDATNLNKILETLPEDYSLLKESIKSNIKIH